MSSDNRRTMRRVSDAFLAGLLLAMMIFTASFAWAAPPINSGKSKAVASPATVTANGTATSTITVTVNRSNGSSAGSGIAVTLTAAGGSSIISTSPATTNSAGIATFAVTDTVVESVTYTAVAKKAGGATITIAQKPIVDFIRAAPTIVKGFSPSSIGANGTSTLTVTLTNPNTSAITGAAFTDSYPTNLINAAMPALSNTCGGTATASAGGGSLALSGATIPASSSCAVTVAVTSATAASYTNNTGAVTTTNAPSGTSASATLTVLPISPANSTVVANPTLVPADNSTTTTITVTLRDGANNPVPNQFVFLAPSSANVTLVALSGFLTDSNGQATFTYVDGVAESVIFTATTLDISSFSLVSVVQTATVTFGTFASSFNAFETSYASPAATGNIYTKIAGTGFSLAVVAVSGGTQSSSFSGNVKLELLANTGTPGTGYGADNCPTSSAVIGTTIPAAALTSGRATVAFAAVPDAYRDVRVRIRYPTTSPTIVSCSTDSFAIRPAAFVAAQNTPALNAGSSFSLQVTAVRSDLTTVTTNYNGTPALNLAAITGTPGFTSAALAPQIFPAAVSGVSNNTFTYDDVGTFTLPATSPGTYGISDGTFTSSVDGTSDCVAGSASNTLDSNGKVGCLVGQSAALAVGRFYPDHFDFTSSYAAGCASGGFTYMNQPFTLGYTVTAKSSNNVALKLYSGGNLYLAALNGSTDLVTRLLPPVSNPLSPAWTNGSYTQSSTSYQFARPTTTTADATWGAYDTLNIGVAVDDADGISYAGIAAPTFTGTAPASCTDSASSNCRVYASLTNGATAKMRLGRLWLGNAYGTEKNSLSMPYEMQYWNGQAYVKNTLDNCTGLAAANFGLGNYQGSLSLSPANLPASAISLGVFSAGAGTVQFAAPNIAGSADVVAKLDATVAMCPPAWTPTFSSSGTPASANYLQSRWCGASYKDPVARVTFGIFGSSAKKGPIYIRENY